MEAPTLDATEPIEDAESPAEDVAPPADEGTDPADPGVPEIEPPPDPHAQDTKRWDLTDYIWKIERPVPRRIRVVLYCCPGFAPDLAENLQAIGISAPRIYATSTIRIDRIEDAKTILRHLRLSTDLREAVDRHFAYLARLGHAKGRARHQRRTIEKHLDQVMKLLPKAKTNKNQRHQ